MPMRYFLYSREELILVLKFYLTFKSVADTCNCYFCFYFLLYLDTLSLSIYTLQGLSSSPFFFDQLQVLGRIEE